MVTCGFVIIYRLNNKMYRLTQVYFIHTLHNASISNMIMSVQLDNVDEGETELDLSTQDKNAREYRILSYAARLNWRRRGSSLSSSEQAACSCNTK